MRKSKHFRKDVILARVIFAILCIAILTLISWGVSSLIKNNTVEDTQEMENQQTERYDIPQFDNTEDMVAEPDVTEEVVVYAKTTAQVRMRVEPNTTCDVVTTVPGNTKTLLLGEADGWYKVFYNDFEGYIRADYIELVEETVTKEPIGTNQ